MVGLLTPNIDFLPRYKSLDMTKQIGLSDWEDKPSILDTVPY